MSRIRTGSGKKISGSGFKTRYVKNYPCVAASGRAADPGQVPGEVRRAEGALREGTAGRLLPRQVLGGPQHQHLGREQRLLRRHHNVRIMNQRPVLRIRDVYPGS